jgi:hypothetical protein
MMWLIGTSGSLSVSREQLAAVSLCWLFVWWEQVDAPSLAQVFQEVQGEALH